MQFPVGIRDVLVGGEPVVRDGALTGARPGRSYSRAACPCSPTRRDGSRSTSRTAGPMDDRGLRDHAAQPARDRASSTSRARGTPAGRQRELRGRGLPGPLPALLGLEVDEAAIALRRRAWAAGSTPTRATTAAADWRFWSVTDDETALLISYTCAPLSARSRRTRTRWHGDRCARCACYHSAPQCHLQSAAPRHPRRPTSRGTACGRAMPLRESRARAEGLRPARAQVLARRGRTSTSVVLPRPPRREPAGPGRGPAGPDGAEHRAVLAGRAAASSSSRRCRSTTASTIPRPCIDATNVGYNVEWSQELRLRRACASTWRARCCVDMLRRREPALGLAGAARTTIFDMSVGYDLAGIRSPPVRAWIDGHEGRARAGGRAARARSPTTCARPARPRLPDRLSDQITLSTFHGCPAERDRGHRALPAHRDGRARHGEAEPDAARPRGGGRPAARRARLPRDPDPRRRTSRRTCSGTQALEITDRLTELARVAGPHASR